MALPSRTGLDVQQSWATFKEWLLAVYDGVAPIESLKGVIIQGSSASFNVVDENLNVVFQIGLNGEVDTVKLSIRGNVGVNSVGRITTDAVAIEKRQDYAYSVSDENGNMILGVNNDGQLVADFSLVPAPSVNLFKTGGTYDYEVNQLFTFGQSLSVGQAYPSISTTQNYDNLMFTRAMRPVYDYPTESAAQWYAALVPAVEENNAVGWIGSLGETPNMGTGDMIKERILAEDNLYHTAMSYQMLLSSPGYGATTIAQISKGTSHYNRMIEQATYGKNLSNAANKTHAVQAVTWTQGESDYISGTTRATYTTQLNTLVSDFNADLKAVTGQPKNIPLISYQVATHKTGGSSVPSIALAQLDVEASNALVYIATPMYHFPYNDGFHLNNVGSRWLGAYYGLAYKRIVIDGIDWKPVKPIGSSKQGKVAVISFNTPSGKLALDTTAVAYNTNYGFELVDSAGAALTISSVSIIGPSTVKIVAAATIPAGAKLRYAWSGSGNYGPVTGPRGNLRDTQGDTIIFDPQGINKPMHNWCVIFELEI